MAELLSSGLQTAIDQIRAGKLCLSSTVKQGEGCDRSAHMSGWGGSPPCNCPGDRVTGRLPEQAPVQRCKGLGAWPSVQSTEAVGSDGTRDKVLSLAAH